MADLYFDREGQPITLRRWTELFEDTDYRRVALTEGRGWSVSTVWLGIDMGWGQRDRPVIFESMVFGGPLADEMIRYADEADAHAGHEVLVATVEQEIRRRRIAGMRKRKHTGGRSRHWRG